MDSNAIAAQLRDYDAHKVTSTDALNEALKQYGVPEIRNTVSGLRTTVANTTNSLNAVDPSVTGRTQGSLVTEAQRQRQVANERAPIAEQLQGFNASLGENQKTLDDAQNQATTLATNKVNDYNSGRSALASQYDIAYKREQDAAQREAERQALAEQQRQFNVSQATARGASSYSGGGGSSKVSAADTKAAAATHVAQSLQKMSGRDGFVSRATFGAALSDFQAAGLGDTRKFWQMYGRYVNPSTKAQYPGYGQR